MGQIKCKLGGLQTWKLGLRLLVPFDASSTHFFRERSLALVLLQMRRSQSLDNVPGAVARSGWRSLAVRSWRVHATH